MSKRQVTFFFGADASKFVAATKRIERNLDTISRTATRAGSSMTRMFTAPIMAAGGALLATSVKAAEFADNIDKMAIRTGLSREQLQELTYVTDQLGVSMSAVETAADALRRRLPQIESGTGTVSEIMGQLGVNVRDAQGQLKSMESLMPEVIARLARVQNQTERSAMSLQIFGRSASQLAPLFDAGSDRIDALSDKARQLGLVMGDDAVAELVQFKDAMSEVQQQISAAGRDLGMILLPVVRDEFIPFVQTQAIPAIRAFAQRFTEMDTEGKKNVIMWAGIIAAAGPGLLLFGQLTKVISGTTVAIRAMTVAIGANPFAATIIATTTLIGLLHTLSRRALEARDALVAAYQVGDDTQVPGTAEFGIMIGKRLSDALQEQALGAQRGQERLQQLDEEIAKYRNLLLLNQQRMEQQREEITDIQSIGREHARVKDAIDAVTAALAHNLITGRAMSAEQIQLLARHAESVEILGSRLREVSAPAGDVHDVFTNMDAALEALMPIADTFVNSLGHGMANVLVHAQSLHEALSNIGKLLASAAIQRGIQLLLSGGIPGASGFFGDGGGLFGNILKGITGTKVNDALITSSGQVIQFHPDDNILAMKDLSKMPTGGGNMNVHVTGRLVAQGSEIVALVENSRRYYR
jgi:hypothetical protein